MNPDRLLANFDRLSDAPDAIPRLRRFILDLAIRGKLVPQDPDDEPASELLRGVGEATHRLAAEGKIRWGKACCVRALEAIAPDHPPGWVRVKGSNVFPTRSGNSKLIKGKLYSAPENGLFPGFSAAGQDVWVDHWEYEGCAAVLSAVGARCGKAFFANGKWCAIANTHIVWLLPEVANPAFAMLLLDNEDFWLRSGGAQPFVKVKQTLERPLLLPPLSEQHRIVAQVDEMMALCDRLAAARNERESRRDRLVAASLHRLSQPVEEDGADAFHANARFYFNHLPRLATRPGHIKQLRQTILDLAIRGKLVTQDPTDEPASELLKRIAAKKAAFSSRGRKGRELVDSSENTDEPFAVPRTWKWSRLGEIAFEMRYGTARKCDYNIKGTPVLRIPNVSGGKINLTDIKFGVLTTKEIEVLSLRLGDLLLVRSNGSLDLVGRCAEVEGNAEGMSFAGYLVRVRLSSIVTVSSYVRVAMNTDHVRDQIEKPIRSAVGLKNVNSTELAALTIPLPPLAEQHRIVAKVDELMALCDRLEVNFWKIETDSRRLVEAVLHEALVPDAAREEAA